MIEQPRKEMYGQTFSPKWSLLDIELWCFRNGLTPEQGGLGKAEHWWRVVGILWGPKNPVGNKTKLFIRNPWSEDMIEELCTQRYCAFGGCGGSCKSETLALWVIVNYLANARKVLGIILSTSLKEARKRIWGSLVDFVRAIPAPGLPLKVVDSMGIIRYISPSFIASDRASIALVAAERKQEKEAIGKLIGMHNDLVIVVADELSELMDSIMEYALPGGNLSTNPDYQFIGLANPPGYYDPFAKLWRPADGWTSINVNSYRWKSEYGTSLHFDAMESPNVLAGKTIYPFLPTLQKIDEAKKAEGGETSLRFWRMIRGFPSPAGAEDMIYAQSDIVKFEGDASVIWNDEPIVKCAALDPGFTNGGDRTIACIGAVGVTNKGVRTLCYTKFVELVEDVTKLDKENRSYQIARQFKELCEAEGVYPQNAAIDSTGAGGPFCDVVDVVWSRAVLRVYFGGKPSTLPVSLTDPKPANERYYDRVTEIWYSGKELLRQGQLKGIPPKMAIEMCERKYGTIGANKLIYVESKIDMKFRMQKSPDFADCGFILLDLGRQRLGFAVVMTPEQRQQQLPQTGWRGVRQRLTPRSNMSNSTATTQRQLFRSFR